MAGARAVTGEEDGSLDRGAVMERGVERLKGRFLPAAAVRALHLLKTQRPAPRPLTSLLANLAPTEDSPRAFMVHSDNRLLHPHPTPLTETNSSAHSLLKPPSLQPTSHLAAIWDVPRPPFSVLLPSSSPSFLIQPRLCTAPPDHVFTNPPTPLGF